MFAQQMALSETYFLPSQNASRKLSRTVSIIDDIFDTIINVAQFTLQMISTVSIKISLHYRSITIDRS